MSAPAAAPLYTVHWPVACTRTFPLCLLVWPRSRSCWSAQVPADPPVPCWSQVYKCHLAPALLGLQQPCCSTRTSLQEFFSRMENNDVCQLQWMYKSVDKIHTVSFLDFQQYNRQWKIWIWAFPAQATSLMKYPCSSTDTYKVNIQLLTFL